MLCPRCRTGIDVEAEAIVCGECGYRYPRLGTIPLLVSEPQQYLTSCAMHLAALGVEADRSVRVLDDARKASDAGSMAQARCQRMIEAVRAQVADIHAVLDPVLAVHGATSDPAARGYPIPPPLTYIPYLYRDWSWPGESGDESDQALALVDAVRDTERPLGRTLVLGAGACRLPYDLHRRDASARTLVIDIDPFLFTVAETVIRGGSMGMTEANAEVTELDRIATRWTLRAPHGPLEADSFQFLLADGLDPPLVAGAFDTIVTSWFIDLVATDLPAFVATVHRLLAPEGRWLNLGPLRYPSDVPLSRRYAREEVFELVERTGFTLGAWRTASVPYLVSRTSARGRVEFVMAFSAGKRPA